MLKAMDIAKYFLAKDIDRNIFNLYLIERNGRKFYEGNAKLNKLLHLSQNIYLAINEKLLFSDDLYAYENGAVVPSVIENYARMQKSYIEKPNFDEQTNRFLDKIFYLFKDVDIDELIALSHEDDEWAEKSKNYSKSLQRMDSLSRANEYKKQYADGIMIMNKLDVCND